MSTPSPPPQDVSPVIKKDPGTSDRVSVPLKLDSIDVDTSEGPQPPALPPRPPPRPRPCHDAAACHVQDLNQGLQDSITNRALRRSCWLRKYVFLCTACGGLAFLLGVLFLAVYYILRAYTSTLIYFETIPSYVPAAMLICTGTMVMSLAGRRNRNTYMIKVSGICCLACAIVCVVVTVTTTVYHMSRLQSLRECVYTMKTQTCTCYSVLLDMTLSETDDEGNRYIFNFTPDCEVIHGALYSCLRAMFGLSVIGILVCIFSCMLVYQLLSHEKKKMYWEQLELRCRYLSRQQRSQHCSCCDECRYPLPTQEMFPWELDDRYWSPRVGNLYSPNPGGQEVASTSRRSGWSWRRLPWSRATNTNTNTSTNNQVEAPTGCMNNPLTLRVATASPDSQYGFSSQTRSSPNLNNTGPAPQSTHIQLQTFNTETSPSFYMWGPPPPYSSPCRREPLLNLLRQRSPQRVVHNCHQGRQCRPKPPDNVAEAQGAVSVESPKRCKDVVEVPQEGSVVSCSRAQCTEERCEDVRINKVVRVGKKFPGRVDHLPNVSSSNVELGGGRGCTENYVNTSCEGELMFDEDNAGRESNTLPVLKVKKFVGSCADVPGRRLCHGGGRHGQEPYRTGHEPCRSGAEDLAGDLEGYEGLQACHPECCQTERYPEQRGCQFERRECHDNGARRCHVTEVQHGDRTTDCDGTSNQNVPMSPRMKYLARLEGIANKGFDTQESANREPTESEVYFADVSSCCNVSVKNDGHDSSIYDEALDPQKPNFQHCHMPHTPHRSNIDNIPISNHHPHSPTRSTKEEFIHVHSPVRSGIDPSSRNIHPHRALRDLASSTPHGRPFDEETLAIHPHHRSYKDRTPDVEKHVHPPRPQHRTEVLQNTPYPEQNHYREGDRVRNLNLDDEILEEENLLQSNCFSYQRFSKSQGFVLRNDQEESSLRSLGNMKGCKLGNENKFKQWDEDLEMECSSNSATPVTENTDSSFISPLTPNFDNDPVPFYGVDSDRMSPQSSPGRISPYEQIGSINEDSDYLAPDAQYETIPPQTRKREDVNANEQLKAHVETEKPIPQRRRFNLNLSCTAGTSPSVREILNNFENMDNFSTTEDESELQQSDVTMDSGCQSDEFTSRRHVVRTSLRNKENGNKVVGRKEVDVNIVRSVNV